MIAMTFSFIETLTPLVSAASGNISEMKSNTTTTTSLPPFDDINTNNVTAVIGALVVFGFIMVTCLLMACHSVCAFCFGKQGICRRSEDGINNNSEDSVYTIEQNSPPIVIMINKKAVLTTAHLREYGII